MRDYFQGEIEHHKASIASLAQIAEDFPSYREGFASEPMHRWKGIDEMIAEHQAQIDEYERLAAEWEARRSR